MSTRPHRLCAIWQIESVTSTETRTFREQSEDNSGQHLNVPLMWAAAAGDNTCPVLQWLASAVQHVESMFVAGSIVSGHDAAVVGWEALSEVMRSWDIRSREDLSEWIHRQGFPRPRWGAHISAPAQERILTMAGAVDARVNVLEAVYMQVALLCMHVPMPVQSILHEAVRGTVGRQRTVFPETFLEGCWAVMDVINLEDLFQLRFPVLQSCPHLTCEAGSDKQMDKSWKPATRLRGHMTQFWRRGHGKHSASSQCCCSVVLKVKDG